MIRPLDPEAREAGSSGIAVWSMLAVGAGSGAGGGAAAADTAGSSTGGGSTGTTPPERAGLAARQV
jgi:hypothetical protein